MEEDTDRVWEEFLMYRVELKVWRLAFNVKHELSDSS